jgi:O-antigen ligase
LSGVLITQISSEVRIKAAVVSAALSLCTLHFSPALSSISLLVFFACVISLFRKEIFLQNRLLVIFALLWCLAQLLIQLGFGIDQESARKLLLRLPLWLLPLIWCIKPDETRKFTATILLFTGVVHTWIGGASVLNYITHYRFLNQMVLESKPLPLFSSVYHIEFSLILAVVCILQLSFSNYLEKVWQRRLMAVSFMINIVSLHILSARTGILAFWLGVPFLINHLPLPGWLMGPKKWLLLLIPLSMVLIVPSLRNRIINTADDLLAVKQSHNLSDKSFGRRWEAWKVAVGVIREKPLTGVGLAGVENAMQSGFEKKQTYLPVTDRIQPHNQLLELALQSGIGVLLFFLAWLFLLFLRYRAMLAHTGISILMALGVSMFFESYMERQAGVAVFVVSLFFVLFGEKKE